MREAYRLQKQELNERLKNSDTNLVVFFIYTGKHLEGYDMVFKKMGNLLNLIFKNISTSSKPM